MSNLFKTRVPEMSLTPRDWYLQNWDLFPAPAIAHSSFVPSSMVHHLMKNKKFSALTVKFQPNQQDKITNMEGALHTFVTPIVEVIIHGDYAWRGGHSVVGFGSFGGLQRGRKVWLSALIQQDFEDGQVMMRVASLREGGAKGLKDMPLLISAEDKKDDQKRGNYDEQLRRYMIYHLTALHRLPSVSEVKHRVLSTDKVLENLSHLIQCSPHSQIPSEIQNTYVSISNRTLSIEIIFNTALHQIRNEFFLLEKLSFDNGYVYTFNPPAIFVSALGPNGGELISRIHALALKYFLSQTRLRRCRTFAWSDFSSKTILNLLRFAFSSHPHILVVSNSQIFLSPPPYNPKSGPSYSGLYISPKGAEDSMLVIHNNSDGFGQNIESEGPGGSLDGVVGTFSSAAASLRRERTDLCSRLFCVEEYI